MKRALEGLAGAHSVDVNLERERAIVEFDPRRLATDRILEAVRRTVMLPRIRQAIGGTMPPRHGGRSR